MGCWIDEDLRKGIKKPPSRIPINDVAEDVIAMLNRYGIKIKDIDAVFKQIKFIISERVIPIRGEQNAKI